MRSTPTRIAVAIVLAGLVAVAAGCGGGSKNSTPGPTPSTTATIKSGSTSSGSGAAPSFASAKNCQDLAGLATKVASAVSASSSGNLNSVLQTESTELHALAQAAPSDIRGDFQTFSTAFSGFLQALQKSGYKPGSTTRPTAAQIAALADAEHSFNTPKLKQAELHLSAWARQNCKGVHVGG
jgi:FlaG/FlaF family flagellin (archaellin)